MRFCVEAKRFSFYFANVYNLITSCLCCYARGFLHPRQNTEQATVYGSRFCKLNNRNTFAISITKQFCFFFSAAIWNAQITLTRCVFSLNANQFILGRQSTELNVSSSSSSWSVVWWTRSCVTICKADHYELNILTWKKKITARKWWSFCHLIVFNGTPANTLLNRRP